MIANCCGRPAAALLGPAAGFYFAAIDDTTSNGYNGEPMAQTKSFTDQIRDVIEACDESRYSICKRAGIDQSILSRFMHHKSFPSEPTLNRLAGAVGIAIVAIKPKQVTHGVAGKAKR